MSVDHKEILKKTNAITDEDLKMKEILPDRRSIVNIIKELQVVLLPEFFHFRDYTQENALEAADFELRKVVHACRKLENRDLFVTDDIVDSFLNRLPHVKALLKTDIQAIYDGDPAASSKAEVILCYPGFYAISIFRIAHELYALHVPYIPRVMTEYAHGKTGIDINPGAKIGPYFCIDHGTGVVVGETAVIGEHVKLYQGVTIGAKSFQVDEDGLPVKGGKRHPNIGNNVVIYANATILGGDTYIGDNCVIGGSVWLTRSVEAGHTVYNTKNEQCRQYFNSLGKKYDHTHINNN